MVYKTMCDYYLNEIKSASIATRKCLAGIPEDLYNFKPHEKSMNVGYRALLVADILKPDSGAPFYVLRFMSTANISCTF